MCRAGKGGALTRPLQDDAPHPVAPDRVWRLSGSDAPRGHGLLPLAVAPVDVLHDLTRDAVGVRDLPANFDKARPGQHPG